MCNSFVDVVVVASSRTAIPTDVLGKFSDDEEEDDNEDVSKADRMVWKAKQEDLMNRRKGMKYQSSTC